MRIRDIILRESYADELVEIVQDLLVMYMRDDVDKISTEDFRSALAKQGYVTTTDELIAAVDASGFVSSVDANEIVPGDHLPDDLKGDTDDQGDFDDGPDVSDMAGDAAMKGVKSEIPS